MKDQGEMKAQNSAVPRSGFAKNPSSDAVVRQAEPKHDPHCDCGICAYCNGQEDVWGNRRIPKAEEKIRKMAAVIVSSSLSSNEEQLAEYLRTNITRIVQADRAAVALNAPANDGIQK